MAQINATSRVVCLIRTAPVALRHACAFCATCCLSSDIQAELCHCTGLHSGLLSDTFPLQFGRIFCAVCAGGRVPIKWQRSPLQHLVVRREHTDAADRLLLVGFVHLSSFGQRASLMFGPKQPSC